jgi:hypothetical protein
LRPSPPLQPRRLHYPRLAPPVLHPTCRRYNPPACAFLLYLPVFLPGFYLQLSLQVTPVSLASAFNFRLAPSAALSGRASNGLSACAVFPPSARTGDQLQLSSRAAHLARPQCNSWLAPQVTRLWQRRRLNLWLTPAVEVLRQSWRPVPGSRWLPHLRLAPVACCRLLPFPESFSRVLVGLPACAGLQLPGSTVVRPGISSHAGSLGLRFESRGLRHPIPLTGLR